MFKCFEMFLCFSSAQSFTFLTCICIDVFVECLYVFVCAFVYELCCTVQGGCHACSSEAGG